MERTHQYHSKVIWTGNRGSGTMDYRAYDRYFNIQIDGKPEIKGCSDSAFSGDKSVHNPEDLLLSAVASCHMLWYLHLCSENAIVVLEYTDDAQGTMLEEKDGSGRFQSITLAPNVKIAAGGDIQKAEKLHEQAGKMCFIANSLNVPISYQPTISVFD